MLKELQKQMKDMGVDAYIVPTADPHDTEYVGEHFAARKALSGFTGSAGVLVVLQDHACLWTDGRYFIQAAKELEPSGIQLMKAGLKQTPSISQYLTETLSKGSVVGYDGKMVNVAQTKEYQKAFQEKGIQLNSTLDLVSPLWKDRPALPSSQTFYLDEKYSGSSIKEKLERVRQEMSKYKADEYVVTKIDEVAWLTNLRANDIPSFPVALGYARITMKDAYLYIDSSRLDEISCQHLKQAGFIIREYEDIYEEVKNCLGRVLVDEATINTTLYSLIPGEKVHAISPILVLKTIKNETEIACTKKAHIKDGVACTKFMYWLYHSIGKETITEYSAQMKLQEFRAEQPLYIEDSFTTISAYRHHGAMMHYSCTPQSDIELQPEGLYLVDSGGQYYDGTTDITRTFVLGELTSEQRQWYTLALVGHIRLARCHWLHGAKGSQLDILARQPLWEKAMDYQCGTGHGIGHVLSVHEDNNGFRTRSTAREAVLEAGMITTDEPGVYMEGEYGIRHENELLAVNDVENEYGQFLRFEPLTMVPFCTRGLDVSLMEQADIDWLNDYHQTVYQTISPLLEKEEADWLETICQAVKK